MKHVLTGKSADAFKNFETTMLFSKIKMSFTAKFMLAHRSKIYFSLVLLIIEKIMVFFKSYALVSIS